MGVMEVARSHARDLRRPPVRRNNRQSPSEAPPGSQHTLIGPGGAPRARPASPSPPHTRSRRGAFRRGAFAREFYEPMLVRNVPCCACRGCLGRGHRSHGPTDSDGCRVVYFASRYGLMDWRGSELHGAGSNDSTETALRRTSKGTKFGGVRTKFNRFCVDLIGI